MTAKMKVLVAKRPPSPRQSDDVWSAMHAEIVVSPFLCQDRDCHCDRVHQGVISHGYSTVAEVSETDTSPDALIAACRSHLDSSQWAAVVENSAELDILAEDLISAMAETAAHHLTGTTLRMTFDHRISKWIYTPTNVRRDLGRPDS